MVDRIVQLALEALESKKAALEAEINALREELKTGANRRPRKNREGGTKVGGPKRRSMSAAARKRVSARMRAYWARKRAESAKSVAVGAPAVAIRKRRQMSAAERKALSEKMKAIWAQRKAEAAAKKKS